MKEEMKHAVRQRLRMTFGGAHRGTAYSGDVLVDLLAPPQGRAREVQHGRLTSYPAAWPASGQSECTAAGPAGSSRLEKTGPRFRSKRPLIVYNE